MTTALELAPRLTNASLKKVWTVDETFDWSEKIEVGTDWAMAPELISIYGTETYEALTEEEQKRLSFYEIVNFFSFVLYGERPLISGLMTRMYRKNTQGPLTEYLHHFVDEENKHMMMFNGFCEHYAGKVYPEKKIVLPREYAAGEEDISFFCKVLIVEELGDYYNLAMMSDRRIHPLVAKMNRVHHVDEARHLAFGRELLREHASDYIDGWTDEELARFRGWLVDYLISSWGDFYNPAVYKDAGLPNGYQIRKMALEHDTCRTFRENASAKLVDYFIEARLLEERPSF